MRRIKLGLAAVAAMLAMLAVGSGLAMAQDLSDCEFVDYDTSGDALFLCENDEAGLEDLSNCEFVGYDDPFDRELYLCEVDVEDDLSADDVEDVEEEVEE